ncbi:hypothetical protein MMC29_000991, partial [Sticta canariensis]|nr:hypothetical protein [Sticta canariensis]
FHEVNAKLRERIQSTVAPQKKASLRNIYSVRQWLSDLRNTTALPAETIKQNIQTGYQKLSGVALLDWLSAGGPINWLAKWEKLINQATRYDEPFRSWLRDVCLVWKRVSDLAVFFSNVKDRMEENDTARYTPALISSKIQYYWELKKQGSALRVTNKPKATRSAFTAEKVTLNGEEVDAPTTPEGADSEAPKKKRGKRQSDEPRSSSTGKRQKRNSNPSSESQLPSCLGDLGQA